MQTPTPSLWKELRNDFSEMNLSQLRTALSRINHTNYGWIRNTLRPDEERIKEWLDSKGANAGTLFQFVSRQKRSSYAERYTEKRIHEKWRKLIEIKTELGRVLPDKSPEELRSMVHKVSRWGYGEVKNLSQEEFALRDTILRFNIKPCTLYEWMIHTIVPEDFKRNLEQGLISVSTAKRMLANRERQRKVALEVRLLEDARRLVREVFE